MKEKFTFWIDTRNKQILEQSAKFNGGSMGKVLNGLIYQKLRDPIKVKREQAKEVAKQLNAIRDELHYLEDLKKKEDMKKVKV